jgi:hypothetical protein
MDGNLKLFLSTILTLSLLARGFVCGAHEEKAKFIIYRALSGIYGLKLDT